MIKKSFLLLLLSAPIFYSNMSINASVPIAIPCEQEIAVPFFAELSELYPSQMRYSSHNVEQKIAEIKGEGGAVWDQTTNQWILGYNQGKSAVSLKDPIPVIKARIGYVLADGHHHVLASHKLGAKNIAVIVVADLSALNEEQFWQEAEKNGWAYPYTIEGKKATPPLLFTELQEDPNRYFASLIARKYRIGNDMTASRGAEYPVWIKVGKDIPFIEFRIADALWKKEIIYDYKMGNSPSEEFVEKARSALVEAQIEGLRVISQRTHHSELRN